MYCSSPLSQSGGSMKYLCSAIAFATVVFLGASHASAQETCLLYQRAMVIGAGYAAPAAAGAHGPSMASSIRLGPPLAFPLFNGATPQNGFMVRVFVQSTASPPY